MNARARLVVRGRAAAVAVVAVAALLAACSAAPTVASTSSPSTRPSPPVASRPSVAPADPAAAASAITAGDGSSSTSGVFTGLDGVMVTGVSATADGMIAVGSVESAAAAWTSVDGAVWEPLQVDGALDVPTLRAVAVVDGLGVAFGGSDDGPSRQWTLSADKDAWRERSASGIDGRVNAVAGDADRWIAAGDVVDAESGTSAAGAVWTSDNAERWQRAAEFPLNEGTISDVAVNSDTVVVVGFDVAGGRVWTSTDAGADLQAVDPEVFAAASIEGVAPTADGFLALGRGLGDLRPVVWTSDDGLRWTRDDAVTDVFAPDRQINDLATVGGRILAVGSAPEGGAVWTSDDGASWDAAP